MNTFINFRKILVLSILEKTENQNVVKVGLWILFRFLLVEITKILKLLHFILQTIVKICILVFCLSHAFDVLTLL